MPIFIVKSQSGNFDSTVKPEGFRGISALENRFFICESPTKPEGKFVVEFPDEEYAKINHYLFKNGKKVWLDVFDGKVNLSEDVDRKNRRVIQYTEDQMKVRLSIIVWIMLNVFLPDKARLMNLSEVEIQKYKNDIISLSDGELARQYLETNFYYDL